MKHFCSEPNEALMPVEMEAEEYNMNHNRRGKAVIFNHDMYMNEGPRPGSDVDVHILIETYKSLGFEVIHHDNLKFTDIQNALTDRKYKQEVLN
jgi:caspase-like apoptosis-related cysteine protease